MNARIEWIDEQPQVLGRVDSGSVGAITWMSDTEDPAVTTYQAWLNRMLDRCGYHGILVDGRVGKYTCGAGAMLGDLKNKRCYLDALASDPIPDTGTMAAVMSVCQTFTFPTKKGDSQPDKPTSDLSPEELALPWGVQDPRTTQVQQDLNNDLDGHDYLPIPVTGSLDAKTCGAMKLASDEWGMDYLAAFGLNCQAFEAPRPRSTGGGGGGPGPTPPTCAPDEQLDPATGQCIKVQCPEGQVFDPGAGQCVRIEGQKVKKGGMPWGLFGLAAAVAAAVYFKYAG